MDISVSRLNERMALQLPAQFPLGLVFVVGTVDRPEKTSNGKGTSAFFLIEREHRLRCLLSDRASESVSLEEGRQIRAGGHLAFDPTQADYYLYARDIELITDETPRQSSLTAIINDYNQRSEAAGLIPAELPEWVKLMAPTEMQLEWQESVAHSSEVAAMSTHPERTAGPEFRPGLLGLGHDVAIAGLSDELLDFLSEAMEGEEEVELTPELVAGFSPLDDSGDDDEQELSIDQSARVTAGVASADALQEDPELETKEDAEQKRSVPWVSILLVLIFLLLATAAIIFLYMFI